MKNTTTIKTTKPLKAGTEIRRTDRTGETRHQKVVAFVRAGEDATTKLTAKKFQMVAAKRNKVTPVANFDRYLLAEETDGKVHGIYSARASEITG